MRRRRHVREIELGDDADRVEDRAELLGEPLDLLVRQRQPREPRDVQTSSLDIAISGNRSSQNARAGPLSGARRYVM